MLLSHLQKRNRTVAQFIEKSVKEAKKYSGARALTAKPRDSQVIMLLYLTQHSHLPWERG